MYPLPSNSFKTLLHVDGDSAWSRTIRRMTGTWREVRHLGTATTAQACIESCRARRPDLIILDPALPDSDGFDLALALANLAGPPRILLLTARTDEVTLFRAGCAHIAGMVWKTGPVRETLRCAIREVLAGRRFFPEDVRQAMCAARRDPTAFFKILSGRELAILPLLCRGMNDRKIGERSGLCPATVKSHRQHIMAKLNLHQASDLVRWGVEKGFAGGVLPSADVSAQPGPGRRLAPGRPEEEPMLAVAGPACA